MKISAKMLADVYSALDKLPEETEIKITDTAIVFEKEEKYIPKKGDLVFLESSKFRYLALFDKNIGTPYGDIAFALYDINEDVSRNYLIADAPCLAFDFSIGKIRLANDSEKALFFENMHESGYDFDFEKMKVVPFRWRAKNGSSYFVATEIGINQRNEFMIKDDASWFSGNYFKTKEQAESYRQKRLKEIGGNHDND